MSLIFPVVMVVLVVGWYLYGHRKMAQGMAENADKNVGSVATRLGMSVVEGDPQINLLYFQQPSGDFKRTIRLAGQPYGRPTSLIIIDGQQTAELIVARRVTHTFGCYLEAALAMNCAAFEVVLREPNKYLMPQPEFAERSDLVETSTGNPLLDQQFIVRAQDPRVGPFLASALMLLSTHHYVHLVGEGQRVWMPLTRMALPYFSSSAEECLLGLETLAASLEGKPAPAALAGAHSFGAPAVGAPSTGHP
jgi:hypothetical protein